MGQWGKKKYRYRMGKSSERAFLDYGGLRNKDTNKRYSCPFRIRVRNLFCNYYSIKFSLHLHTFRHYVILTAANIVSGRDCGEGMTCLIVALNFLFQYTKYLSPLY